MWPSGESRASSSRPRRPAAQDSGAVDRTLTFAAIQSLLAPDETARLLELGKRATEQEQEWLLGQIRARSPEGAAALLRETLTELGDAKPQTAGE